MHPNVLNRGGSGESALDRFWLHYRLDVIVGLIVAVSLLPAALTGNSMLAGVLGTLIAPLVICYISWTAFWAVLSDEYFMSRWESAIVRLALIHFCIAVPGAIHLNLRYPDAFVVGSVGIAAIFGTSLAAAGVLRARAYRLSLSEYGPPTVVRVTQGPVQFRLIDLFRLVTLLCIVLAAESALLRFYRVRMENLQWLVTMPPTALPLLAVAAMSSAAALFDFCLCFSERDRKPARLAVLFAFIIGGLTTVGMLMAGMVVELITAAIWLAVWTGVLLIPMAIFCGPALSYGWRLAIPPSRRENSDASPRGGQSAAAHT